MSSSSEPLSREGAWRIARLVALYAAQGIPFGFTMLYVPLQIAERPDFSYAKATLFTLASFPWLLKLLWAPAADTWFWTRLGRRRSWILPAQALLVLTSLAATGVNFDGPLWKLFVLTALLNLWASLQDTAVDGLAVEMLRPSERGLGNAAQVAGYKLGMVAGGTGLAIVAHRLGPTAAMYALSASIALLMLVPLRLREPAAPENVERSGTGVLRHLAQIVRRPGWTTTLLFIATVKAGEVMASNLVKPYLVREAGFSIERAAWAVGFIGMLLSLAGSVAGGHVAGRAGRLRALKVLGLTQAAALLLLALAVQAGVRGDTLVLLIALEHFAAGLFTPALFAYMMDVTEPAIAATHYTLLATVELVAKGAAGAAAGPLADVVGVPVVMLLAGSLGALPLLLLTRIRPPAPRPTVEIDAALSGAR